MIIVVNIIIAIVIHPVHPIHLISSQITVTCILSPPPPPTAKRRSGTPPPEDEDGGVEEAEDAGSTVGISEVVEGTVVTEEAREELVHSSVEGLIRRARKKDCFSSDTACPFVPLVGG